MCHIPMCPLSSVVLVCPVPGFSFPVQPPSPPAKQTMEPHCKVPCPQVSPLPAPIPLAFQSPVSPFPRALDPPAPHSPPLHSFVSPIPSQPPVPPQSRSHSSPSPPSPQYLRPLPHIPFPPPRAQFPPHCSPVKPGAHWHCPPWGSHWPPLWQRHSPWQPGPKRPGGHGMEQISPCNGAPGSAGKAEADTTFGGGHSPPTIHP